MSKKNVMLCGTSISKGIIYDSIANKYRKCEATFVGILDKIFNTKILNISKFGNTVARAEKKFYKSFNENKPDMVIFELGGNDCDFNWDEVSNNPMGKHIPKTDLDKFKDSLETMTTLVKKEGKRPILMNLAPLDPDAYFNWISHNDEKRKDNILSWLGSVSKIYWWQERYNSAVQDVARKQNIEMIDVRKEFLKKFDFRDCLCEDGIHPNDKGQILIANALESYFKTAG
ncbi:MAG: SGNH/GDSL hydrolase family protein [Clostridiales bacterium]|nr:SGNH/GDSL hydrolase family protein [Clostridiales bacterium]